MTIGARADDYVLVPNASQLQWTETGGKVYLRNLNQFDSTFLPCCWNFYFDITTDEGKMQWSFLLTRITTGGRVWLGFSSKSTAGSLKYIGDWQ